jgi:predicted  nucleic acid-binding Zn-ribbon protein
MEELLSLKKAFAEQRAALEAAVAQRQVAEDSVLQLQEELNRLRTEMQQTGPASDLQRQFREVASSTLTCAHVVPSSLSTEGLTLLLDLPGD